MLVFVIKQMLSLKRAILGRREPHQLAWGLALGLLLGFVPHGNLIALVILLLILSLQVNHGMAAVTAVVATMLASRMDHFTHSVGNYLLTHPDLAPMFAAAWQLPVVPWTDINNTVVTGSLAVGLAFVVPAYLFSYPIFHWLAPESNDLPNDVLPPSSASDVADEPSPPALRIHEAAEPCDLIEPSDIATSNRVVDIADLDTQGTSDTLAVPGHALMPRSRSETVAIDAAFEQAAVAEELAGKTVVDTRIEVVRMYPNRAAGTKSSTENNDLPLTELEQVARQTSEQDQPMSEALNYLLRQLRDARQGRAA
jgi:uncharacterized protein (TIGR03546 family)